jgi:hypothetical protein
VSNCRRRDSSRVADVCLQPRKRCGENENISHIACQGLSRRLTYSRSNNPRLPQTVASDFGVSKHRFHVDFDSGDKCVLTAFDEGVAYVERLIVEAARCEAGWHDRVRAALSMLLLFLDEEPGWARFLIAEPPIAGAAVLERRRQVQRSLVRALMEETQVDTKDSGWVLPSCELTAELVVGGVFSVIRARVLDDARATFAELEEPLMAFISAAYRAADGRLMTTATGRDLYAQRRPVRATYRTTRVLSAIGDAPGLNNREIADAAGLSDQGQTSKLLHRLERRGLLQNRGLGQRHGGSNAWVLSAYGERVLEATRHSLVPGVGAVTGRRMRGAT